MTIIAPETLLERLGDPDLRICDVRWYLGRPGAGRAAYQAGHLPGALFVDLETDLSDPGGLGAPGRHPLPDPTAFARRMAGMGIGTHHLVVVYDDAGGGVAARLWWMLDALGHRRVAVLDGGLDAWRAVGGPLVSAEPHWPPASLTLDRRWPRIVTRADLRARLGEVVLLDARAPERYRGDTEPVDPVAGHIPTARSAPLDGNLDPRGRFRPPSELRERFRRLGVTGDRPVVVACGSGVNACQNALALRLAGLADPLLYPGSYSDWSRSGLPVIRGSEPGLPPAWRRIRPRRAGPPAGGGSRVEPPGTS